MESTVIKRITDSKVIYPEHKKAILKLFSVSDNVSFGKIAPRMEGYLLNGNGYPRCTNVLSMDGSKASALLEWAKKEVVENAKKALIKEIDKLDEVRIRHILDKSLGEPDRQRDSAAHAGTNVHDNIEKWLNGEEYEESIQLNNFKDIWEKEGATLICTELPLAWSNNSSDRMGFGGRMDILGYKDGKFIIYDNKTSKSVHSSYALQLSAYKAAVEQMSEGLIEISTAKIIHVPDMKTLSDSQKKSYKRYGNLIECKNLDKAFKHFELLLNQYYFRNNKYF